MLFFSACLFKARPPPEYSSLVGQLTHAWAAELNQFSHAKLAAGMNDANAWHGDAVWCHKVTELKPLLLQWHSVMSQSHRIKAPPPPVTQCDVTKSQN